MTSSATLDHGDQPRRRTALRQLGLWATRIGLGNKLAIALTVIAVAAGAATYAALTAIPPFGDPDTVYILLNIDSVVLLVLGVLVARRLAVVLIRRRQGGAGARLHSRFVLVFGILAATPAILMTILSATFFYFGVQAWFSDRVRTAIDEAQVVAQSYLQEHQEAIRADVLEIANDLNRVRGLRIVDPERYGERLLALTYARNLTAAIVFDGSRRVIYSAGVSIALENDQDVDESALERARQGEIVRIDSNDRVRALIRLDSYDDLFLYVGRAVDPRVLRHVEVTQTAVKDYTELTLTRNRFQVTVTLIFILVSLLLLLVAVWFGLFFAKQLATPIAALTDAAEQVRGGDLSARVREPAAGDELAVLSRAFNRMTNQLQSQRTELVEANRQLDLRRRFTETVLAGVSSGVLSLDREGCITLANVAASEFLAESPGALVGRRLAEIIPETVPLLAAIDPGAGRLVESEIQLRRDGQPARTLLIRISAEQPGAADQARGFVVTFEDITELVLAQRKAAWADVARRIAHEIKNPLTPIQLSAERLKRKYLKEITSDPETFTICTDTIVRQVSDIGRMVDEFSAFARMPTPVLKPERLIDLCRQTLILHREARAGVQFHFSAPAELIAVCDGRQIAQALTNLIQNALDAIEGRQADGERRQPGEIWISVAEDDGMAVITVADNGRGLPSEGRERLTEPYVTTRTKGTGLGLAIVKKIMEDHAGTLRLADRPGGGARVSLVFPVGQAAVADITQARLRYGA